MVGGMMPCLIAIALAANSTPPAAPSRWPVTDFVALTATFESEEFRARLEELGEQFGERERKAFQELGEEAQQQGIAME